MPAISPECLDMIALNLIPGLGPVSLKKLLNRAGSADAVLRMDEAEIRREAGPRCRYAGKKGDIRSSGEYLEELEYIKKQGVRVVCPADRGYPPDLNNIYDPPPVLYILGEMPGSGAVSAALVGARSASLYGIRMAGSLAEALAAGGVTVVSGLARGIDSSAHRGAIKGRGRTVAVIGSGLRHLYSSSSRGLAENIRRSGAVITEFSSRTEPSRITFPRRNRIISGLSKVVVVVEAARKSGALITADLALEQGKDVLAVPGPVDSVTSRGSNGLIQKGAKLVASAEDIFEELGIDPAPARRDAGTGKKNAVSSSGGLSPRDRKIVEAVSPGGRTHIDRIAARTGMEVKDLHRALLDLELRGKVKLMPGLRYEVPMSRAES